MNIGFGDDSSYGATSFAQVDVTFCILFFICPIVLAIARNKKACMYPRWVIVMDPHESCEFDKSCEPRRF